MAQSRQSSYAVALGELRMIRDRLVPGRVGPEEVEALTARAAIVVTTAQAALRRATTRLEFLEETAGGAAAAPGQTNGSAEHREPLPARFPVRATPI